VFDDTEDFLQNKCFPFLFTSLYK